MIQTVDARNQVTEIMNSLRKIVRALRVASRAQEKLNGLSAAQFLVLQGVAAKGDLSINELAALTFTHQSSVSVVVTKLVNRNLVVRKTSPEDARKVQISITSSGAALAQNEAALIQNQMFDSLLKMSTEDRHHFARLMHDFIIGAKMLDVAAEMFFEGESPQD